MVEVIWTEPALNDLDAIADYVAIDDILLEFGWSPRLEEDVSVS